MSEYLKIEPNRNYFITLTVKDWVDVFTRECYVNIVLDSIRYCQQSKGLDVYSYVIMPTHIHMIAGTDGNLSDILRDMKRHTARLIIKEIQDNLGESRREWMMERFRYRDSKGAMHHQFWQEGNYPVELYSMKFILQKQHYIHMNPVKTGMVSWPQHYRLSSACEDSPIKVMPIC
ncbi:MAG: transposase [Bacteroidia bacterium]|jgi:REP element-mobilizing transposase RayT